MGLKEELSGIDRAKVAQLGEPFLRRLSLEGHEDYEMGRALARDYQGLDAILETLREFFQPIDEISPEELNVMYSGAALALGLLREVAEAEDFTEKL